MGFVEQPVDGQVFVDNRGVSYTYLKSSNVWFKTRVKKIIEPSKPVLIERINLFSVCFPDGYTHNFKLKDEIPYGKNGLPRKDCSVEVFVGGKLVAEFSDGTCKEIKLVWGKTIVLQKEGKIVQFANCPNDEVRISYAVPVELKPNLRSKSNNSY